MQPSEIAHDSPDVLRALLTGLAVVTEGMGLSAPLPAPRFEDAQAVASAGRKRRTESTWRVAT
jgi:hypothetical protein